MSDDIDNKMKDIQTKLELIDSKINNLNIKLNVFNEAFQEAFHGQILLKLSIDEMLENLEYIFDMIDDFKDDEDFDDLYDDIDDIEEFHEIDEENISDETLELLEGLKKQLDDLKKEIEEDEGKQTSDQIEHIDENNIPFSEMVKYIAHNFNECFLDGEENETYKKYEDYKEHNFTIICPHCNEATDINVDKFKDGKPTYCSSCGKIINKDNEFEQRDAYLLKQGFDVVVKKQHNNSKQLKKDESKTINFSDFASTKQIKTKPSKPKKQGTKSKKQNDKKDKKDKDDDNKKK